MLAQQDILRQVASGGKVRTTVAATLPAAKTRPALDAATPASPSEPQSATPADPAPAPDKIALLH